MRKVYDIQVTCPHCHKSIRRQVDRSVHPLTVRHDTVTLFKTKAKCSHAVRVVMETRALTSDVVAPTPIPSVVSTERVKSSIPTEPVYTTVPDPYDEQDKRTHIDIRVNEDILGEMVSLYGRITDEGVHEYYVATAPDAETAAEEIGDHITEFLCRVPTI